MIDGAQRRRQIAPQLVMGALIVVIGLLFTLENLGFLDPEQYLRYWPAALIAVGLLQLWQGRARRVVSGSIFTFAGVWLLLQGMGMVTVSLWSLWPLLLVFAGASMVWRGVYGRGPERAIGDTHSTVSAMAVLSGVNRGNSSQMFRGGDITAVLGGCQIDLRQATIEGEAVIDVFAMWGGIEIRVPENWSVSGRVTPILGGYEDKTSPVRDAANQRLLVRGLVIMGGVELKN
jgi:predicted membrane protein